MTRDVEITEEEEQRYHLYKIKQKCRQKPILELGEWVANRRHKLASLIPPEGSKPDHISLEIWEKYLGCRSYRRCRNLSIPNLEIYLRDHMGKIGKNHRELFPGAKKKGQRVKYSPNPTCMADVRAIAARAKEIVQAKLANP